MPVYTAIDFETSGTESFAACSVALVRIEGDRLTASYTTLIRPPSRWVLFSWVHGLTWPMLERAPGFREVWPAIAAFMSGASGLVAHNAPFDRKVLEGCCAHFGCRMPDLPFYCTLKGARAALDLPSRGLDALCNYYNIPLNHHEALSDALACARLFVLLQKREGLPAERMRLGPRRAPARPRLFV